MAMLVGACSQQAPQEAATITDALPEIVARVNGVVIDRDAVLKRLEQAHSMKSHQQHTRTNPGPSQPDGQPEARDGSSSDSSRERRQREAEHVKATLHTIINHMLLEELKLQEVARLGLSVSDELLEKRVELIEKQSGSPEALDQQLRQGHTTREEWRTHLHHALLLQELAASRRVAIPVSDEEIRRFWERHSQRLSRLWKTDQPGPVRERIRTLIQLERWPAEEAQWYQDLVREAKIWLDPIVRQLLATPSNHTHPGDTGTPLR